jgi:hypothetical protein
MKIKQAYGAFEREMVTLDQERMCDCLVEWSFHVRDARHHLCQAMTDLEGLELAGETYEQMMDAQKVLAREAYLAVVNVGHALVREACELFAPEEAVAAGKAAVSLMLDALAPYVSRAETELRRIILDGAQVMPFDGLRDVG